MARISVLGAGSWGTALALLLHNNGHEVILWSALGEEIDVLREKRENVSKLPGVKIPEAIDITTDLERSLRDADVAVLAVPSPYIRSTCKRMAPYMKKGQRIVNVAKGVEEKTLMTLSEIIEQELPGAEVSVLSRTQPCGGSGQRASYYLCGKFPQERDSRIPPGYFHESGLSCIYNTGYAWCRAWCSLEKCNCPCCRHCRWTWIWR